MGGSKQNLNPDTVTDRASWGWLLVATLFISMVLRVIIVERGGQYFWSDESRYAVAIDASQKLFQFDFRGAAELLLKSSDHLLFKFIALIPATLQQLTQSRMNVAGIFLSSFSVLNIYLVWRIALAAGAARREAFLAALFLACTCANFYYARHYFPYDVALSFGLLALLVGWSGEGWRRSLGAGVLSGMGFLTYNGSWLFGGLVLIGHVLFALSDFLKALRRAGIGAMGLLLPIGVAVGLARLFNADLVADFLKFSGTVNQGDFGKGGSLIFDYFWSAEGINFYVALVCLVSVAFGAWLARRWTYGMNWVAGVVFVFVGLVALSDAWHVFVVYGRTARLLLPLACLGAAFSFERCWRAAGALRWFATVTLVLVLAQAAVNLAQPLNQLFPQEFTRLAAAEAKARSEKGDQRQMLLLYADHLLSEQALFDAIPDHQVLLATNNPLDFRPYLFEGYNEKLRRALTENDIRMRLIAVNQNRLNYPHDLRGRYPGVIEMTVRLPKDKPGGREPLIVSGSTGKGDILYIIYDSPSTIRLGLDHWSISGIISEPVPVDYDQPVMLRLSTGPLNQDRPEAPVEGDLHVVSNLRHWLYADVNGRAVWSQKAEFHEALPASISYGVNYLGGSTTETKFTGDILRIQSLLDPALSSYKSNLARPNPGALKFVLRLPADKPKVQEPLVVTGKTQAGDLVYIIYDSPTTIRLGFDHWFTPAVISEPVVVDYSKPVVITLSTGALHAKASAASKWLYADVNGQLVWSQAAEFYPTSDAQIAIAANKIGGSTCDPKYTGVILELESVPFPAASASQPPR